MTSVNGHEDLTIFERLSLLSILPEEGSVVTLKVIRDLKDELGLSEHEIKDAGLVQKGNAFSISTEARGTRKAISVGETARRLIVDHLEQLSKNEKLSMDCLPLYERFVEGGLVGTS